MKTITPFALLAAALACTGCVSSKYKLAKPADTLPAVALNLTSTPAPGKADAPSPVEATLNTVLVFQGPGSWKREAYWDEYIVTLANRGPAPFNIESATLTDFQGQAVTPGDNPWDLEKQSH